MLPSILLAVVALFFMIKWWLETKKTKSLNKEVLAQKNELGLNKDFSDAILRNIDAYIVLANRNFLVEKTNYYSLNSEKDDCVLHRVGELLRCKNALDSGACGTHENCKSCPVRASIERCFREKNSFSRLEAPMRLYLSDDTDNYVDCVVSVSGAYMVQNRDEKVLLTVRDITRLKKVQEELEVARRVAEVAGEQKTAFLANMSHEIRTPLNALSGFSSLLTEENLDNETRRQCNEVILQNSELLLKLINDVIDLSSLEFGKIKFCINKYNVVNICRNVIDTVSKIKQTQAAICFITELESMDIETDDARLQQVLINLLINATKFTSQGSIILELRKQSEQELLFSVTDTGCGIPKEKQAAIFRRFEKLNENAQGSGLGLSICQLIIEHIGGKIWIDSDYTGGSRFFFTHPIRQSQSTNPQKENNA